MQVEKRAGIHLIAASNINLNGKTRPGPIKQCDAGCDEVQIRIVANDTVFKIHFL